MPFSVGQAQMARAMDPYMRVARTVTDAIVAKTPLMSMRLLPKRDRWGEPIVNPTALGGAALTAIHERAVNTDPVNQAMDDLGIRLGVPERKIRNIDLTDEEYDDYSRLAGRMTKMRLDQIVRSPDWQRMNNPTKHELFTMTFRMNRDAAANMVLAKHQRILVDAHNLQVKKRTGG
jgi:hypothetical protein